MKGKVEKDLLIRALFLCALVALPVAYGLRYWFWQQGLNVRASLKPQSIVQTPQPHKTDFSKLSILFGDAKESQAKSVRQVQESSLPLKLVASYLAGGGQAAAVFATGGEEQKLYFAGDKIQPGVELVAVEARRVLIKRNGVLENVSLEEEKTGLEPVTARAEAGDKPVVPPKAEPASREQLAEKLNRLRSLARGES